MRLKIYQIEITSRCSLKCEYCPQPTMRRAKQDMPLRMFERALDYPFSFDVVIGHHFGEPLLHPEIVAMCRACFARGLAFGFSTNLNVPRHMEKIALLVENGLAWLKISFHNDIARRRAAEVTSAFPDLPVIVETLESKHSWADQVALPYRSNFNCQPGVIDCEFHHFNQCVVSAQGRLLACCLDAEGHSDFGSLFDFTPEAFASARNKVLFDLCRHCPIVRPVAELQSSFAAYKAMAAVGHDRLEQRAHAMGLPAWRPRS